MNIFGRVIRSLSVMFIESAIWVTIIARKRRLFLWTQGGIMFVFSVQKLHLICSKHISEVFPSSLSLFFGDCIPGLGLVMF